MAYFQLLGTGAAPEPDPAAEGRNRRLPASALAHHIGTWLLLDVTPAIAEQAELALSVTHVALTDPRPEVVLPHLKALDAWLDAPATLLLAKGTASPFSSAARSFRQLTTVLLSPETPTVVGDLTVTALALDAGASPGRWAFALDTGKKRVLYAPGLFEVPERVSAWFTGNDLLVVDGYGWDADVSPGTAADGADLRGHAGVLNRLVSWLDLRNASVLFTNLGPRTPPHAQASTAVRRSSHRADVGFDQQKIPLGR